MTIHLSCNPPTATAQQKGVRIIKQRGRLLPMFYEKKHVEAARKLLCDRLLRHKPDLPLLGPLAVTADWVFPWRKSERKAVIDQHHRRPKDTAPDAANLNKMLIDAMTRMGFWQDDGQIYDERARKWWGATPGITISITEWVSHTQTKLPIDHEKQESAERSR